MRRFLLLLLRRAFAWPAPPPIDPAPRPAVPRDSSASRGAVAWGAIRARYRLKQLVVPA